MRHGRQDRTLTRVTTAASNRGVAVSFRDDSQLDPSEVQRPARPRRARARRRIAMGGGGLGARRHRRHPAAAVPGRRRRPRPARRPAGRDVAGRRRAATSPSCRTGADANARQDCRILGYVNSVQAFWRQEFARRGPHLRARDDLLRDRPVADRLRRPRAPTSGRSTARPTSTSTSTSRFLDELRDQLRRDRRLARAGLRHRARVRPSRPGSARHPRRRHATSQGATGKSVRTELQADCFAGVWAAHATETGLLEPITQAQIDDALNAAAAVGDDRIQRRRRARSTRRRGRTAPPRSASAGSRPATRRGDMTKCDTFGGSI